MKSKGAKDQRGRFPEGLDCYQVVQNGWLSWHETGRALFHDLLPDRTVSSSLRLMLFHNNVSINFLLKFIGSLKVICKMW